MVLYTKWDGKKIFDPVLLDHIAQKENIQAQSKLEPIDPSNLVDSFGRTLLHYAAAWKNPEMVQYLINRGCEVNIMDEVGTTPLIRAMKTTHIPTVRALLEANADILLQHQQQLLQVKNPLQMALAHVGYMHLEVVTMFLNALKRQCSANSRLIAKVLLYVKCPLPLVILLNDVEVTKYMLDKGCNVHERDHNSDTALHYAVRCVDFDHVKLLIENGADVHATNDSLQRPLHLYHFKSKSLLKYQILRHLLNSGASLTASDSQGRTVATDVFAYGQVDDVKILLEYDVDLLAKNSDGSTLLHHVASNKHDGVIELLEGKIFEVNEPNDDGETALWYAVDSVNPRALNFLLRNGADLRIVDKDGCTAFFSGFCKWVDMDHNLSSCIECTEIFLQYGASCESTDPNQKTIFDCMLENDTLVLCEPILTHLAIKEALGKPIDDVNLSKIMSHDRFKTYFEFCKWKIGQMKTIVIYEDVTLFKCLTVDVERLIRYARNQEIIARLERIVSHEANSYLMNFLRKRVAKAVRTAKLRGQAVESMTDFRELHFNLDVIEQIVVLLDDLDLQNVCKI